MPKTRQEQAESCTKKYMGRKTYGNFTPFEKLVCSVHSVFGGSPTTFVDIMNLFVHNNGAVTDG